MYESLDFPQTDHEIYCVGPESESRNRNGHPTFDLAVSPNSEYAMRNSVHAHTAVVSLVGICMEDFMIKCDPSTESLESIESNGKI